MNEHTWGAPDPGHLLIAGLAGAWVAGFALMLSEVEADIHNGCRPRPAWWMYLVLLLVWPAELIARNVKRRSWK